MKNKKKINKILELSNNGIITTQQISSSGIHRGYLQKLVKEGQLYRFSRGLYVCKDAWEDDFYLLQLKYGKGIYSHDTALYLLGYSDRTPAQYTMTFPKGYNTPSLKQENIIVKRVIPKNYSFGIIEFKSPCGNRTLCDILRGNDIDIQIVISAMKKYAASSSKNIHKLMQYAEQLHVKSKVLHYMEVLL